MNFLNICTWASDPKSQSLQSGSFAYFLNNRYFGISQQIPLELRRNIRFQMDPYPAYCSRDECNGINQNYPVRWIGRRDSDAWTALSSDLTLVDFYL